MRYLPLTDTDRNAMLSAIGVQHVNDLYEDVPEGAKRANDFNLPNHQGEIEVERHLNKLAAKNITASERPFFLGAGCYHHHVPATVDYIIQRSEFLTSYTPYQPEIAQGTLMTIFQFQTMIANITGQDVANASMYDGATALAEAALMAIRVTKRNNIHVHGLLHPQYEALLHTYMRNYEDVHISAEAADENTSCIIVQYPDFYGNVEALDALRKQADEVGALLVVVNTEIVALGLLQAPSQADIVVGEAQSIGNAMSYGGPHLGYFACKQAYIRQMPGRLCGETVDEDGKISYVLTLNTREQHIRRDKATSNICSNQGLCATAFTVHMGLLGEIGFKQLAQLNHEKAILLADALENVSGIKLLNQSFFNEFAIELSKPAQNVVAGLEKHNITAGFVVNNNTMLLAVTELTTEDDIAQLATALKEVLA